MRILSTKRLLQIAALYLPSLQSPTSIICLIKYKMKSINDVPPRQVRGKEASLGHFVDHQINPPKWDAWKVLPEAVR